MIDWTIIERKVVAGDINSPAVCAAVEQLSTAVANRHYNYYTQDHEDLVLEGVTKALSMLRAGRFDPSIASLKNYLYTGMRNSMQNYIYGNKKEVPIPELFDQEVEGAADEPCCIEFGDIVKLFQGLEHCYDKHLVLVVRALRDMGFQVDAIPAEIAARLEERIEANEEVTDKLICLIFWEQQENNNNA